MFKINTHFEHGEYAVGNAVMNWLRSLMRPLPMAAVWSAVLLGAGCDSADNASPENALELEFPGRQASGPQPSAWDPALDVPADACDEAADQHELVGRWKIVSGEFAGQIATAEGEYEFSGNRLKITENGIVLERSFELDPASTPKRLDSRLTVPEGTIVFRAIYRLDGDTLTISDSTPFHARPERFVERTTVENDLSLCVLERVKDEEHNAGR